MAQRFQIHPVDPQARLIHQAVKIIRDGGLVVYPTDCCYAFGCSIDSRDAVEQIRRIRQTGKDHNFTLVCRDLSEISSYAKVPNWSYRLVKAHTPGPYTFILAATREVPRRLQNPKKQTIGIRIPDYPVALAIMEALGAPLMSSTLLLPGIDLPLTDPEDIYERLGSQVDLVIDSGNCGLEPSTVVDLTGSYPVLLRQGKGESAAFS